MTVKIAINGYGRIGRNVLRALYESGRTNELQVVAINDLGDANSNAHLTKYDTAHGQFPYSCLLYTSPSPRDLSTSRMPSSA